MRSTPMAENMDRRPVKKWSEEARQLQTESSTEAQCAEHKRRRRRGLRSAVG